MKRCFVVIAALVLLIVIVGCSNPVQPLSPDGTARGLSYSSHGKKMKVWPSGVLSGSADRAAIQSALEMCPPGGVVKLKKGHYYLDMPVVVEGFKGTLRGAGMNKTVIETAEDFEPTELRILEDNEMAIMFGFFWSEDSVTVERMTMVALADRVSRTYTSVFLGGLDTTILANFLVFGAASDDSDSLDAVCRKVQFIAADSTDPYSNGVNVNAPVAICGGAPSDLDPDLVLGSDVPLNGRVEDCVFQKSGGPAAIYFQGDGGSMSFIDSTYVDCAIGILLVELNQGCEILVANNTFEGTMAEHPIIVLPDSRATIMTNTYDDLISCLGGCVIVLASEGNEVYENLTERPDLHVCGDPTTNVIVTDYTSGDDED